jgi:hypothetical protein
LLNKVLVAHPANVKSSGAVSCRRPPENARFAKRSLFTIESDSGPIGGAKFLAIVCAYTCF